MNSEILPNTSRSGSKNENRSLSGKVGGFVPCLGTDDNMTDGRDGRGDDSSRPSDWNDEGDGRGGVMGADDDDDDDDDDSGDDDDDDDDENDAAGGVGLSIDAQGAGDVGGCVDAVRVSAAKKKLRPRGGEEELSSSSSSSSWRVNAATTTMSTPAIAAPFGSGQLRRRRQRCQPDRKNQGGSYSPPPTPPRSWAGKDRETTTAAAAAESRGPMSPRSDSPHLMERQATLQRRNTDSYANGERGKKNPAATAPPPPPPFPPPPLPALPSLAGVGLASAEPRLEGRRRSSIGGSACGSFASSAAGGGSNRRRTAPAPPAASGGSLPSSLPSLPGPELATIPTRMVPVEELDMAFRAASLYALLVWATLATMCHTMSPPHTWRTPSSRSSGRLAEGATCVVMATSVVTKLMYMLMDGACDGLDSGSGSGPKPKSTSARQPPPFGRLKLFNGLGGMFEGGIGVIGNASRIRGAAFAGFVVQSISAISNGAMAVLPTPVRVDRVTGVEVSLLRWCEWVPCAAVMGFMTMAMDASDETGCAATLGVRGLRGAVLFGVMQGLSTLCGLIFPFVADWYWVWWFFMILSFALHFTLHPALLAKIRRASRLRELSSLRPRNVDSIERTERMRVALQLIILITCSWTILICVYFAAWFFHVSPDVRAILECFVEVMSKHYYMSYLIDANNQIFSAQRRTEWRLQQIKEQMTEMVSRASVDSDRRRDSAPEYLRRRLSQEPDYAFDYLDEYSSDEDGDTSTFSGDGMPPETIASRYLRGAGANPSTDLGTAAGDLAKEAAVNLAYKISSSVSLVDLADKEATGADRSRYNSDGVGKFDDFYFRGGGGGGGGGGDGGGSHRRSLSIGDAEPIVVCGHGPNLAGERDDGDGEGGLKRSASADFQSRYGKEVVHAAGDAAEATSPVMAIARRRKARNSTPSVSSHSEGHGRPIIAHKTVGHGTFDGLRPQRRRESSGVDTIESSVSGLSKDPFLSKDYLLPPLNRNSNHSASSSDDDDFEVDATQEGGGRSAARDMNSYEMTATSGREWPSRPAGRGGGSGGGGGGGGGGGLRGADRSQVEDFETEDVLDALHDLILELKSVNPHKRRTSDGGSADGPSGGGTRRGRLKSAYRQEGAVFAPPIPKVVGTTTARFRPETLHDVTVLFSDVVGFTSLCAQLSVEDVGDLIERLFTEFDRLAERHGVTKIDVVGDAYFGLCGIPNREGHAAKAAIFSLEAIKASNRMLACLTKPELGYISIRMGLASGSVVASMIGSGSHLKYTLFGDVVNTASRMESTSLPNKVQCTRETADLIRSQCAAIQVERRGEVEVKGKGKLETFFIHAPKDGFEWDKNGSFFI